MTTIPQPPTIQELIDAHHESKQKRERFHLGCSEVGHHCERYIWLNFRWALPLRHSGRMLRLFRRGHREEETVIADLEAIGCTVTRQQECVDYGGHLRGHIDGVVTGVPQAPKTPHLLEIKTSNLKSFKLLESEGVEVAKPQHFAQMQLYMRALQLTRALYVSVCKDNDAMHIERVKRDASAAARYIERGRSLPLLNDAPPRISERPDWWQCKMCDAHDLCHGSKISREVNCRTCALSTAKADGTWFCERWESTIPNEHQEKGCPSHVLHPNLVPWTRESIGELWHAVYDGKVNGGPDLDGAMSSREILDSCS